MFDAFVTAWGVIALVAWLARMAWLARVASSVEWLRDLSPPEPARWPALSVVITARDERRTVEDTVRALLAQTYPVLEIIAVDDRSTDGTGAILDRLAGEVPWLRVVHIEALPEGWLGKVHALERGRREARGEWNLFTDADASFAPDALRRAIAVCVERDLGFLAVGPGIRPSTFWCDVAKAAFGEEFLLWTRPHRVGDPSSSAFVGVGAFNLVRRDALDRTPGFEWLRMEVVDDLGLGLMLKRSRARCGFLIGSGEVETAWYASWRQMAHGVEKNFFGGVARYSYGRVAALGLVLALVVGGVGIALSGAGGRWALALALVTLAVHLVKSLVSARMSGIGLAVTLLVPIGTILNAFALIRSAWRCRRDGGITWRGTFYPLDALRAGRHVDVGPW